MEQIKYGKKTIEYKIKRGKRKKTVAINITPTSQVLVLVPDFISRGDVGKIVKKKARWILEKQEFFRALASLYPEKEFISGEQILFLGRKYRLKVKQVQKNASIAPKLIVECSPFDLDTDIWYTVRVRKEWINGAQGMDIG